MLPACECEQSSHMLPCAALIGRMLGRFCAWPPQCNGPSRHVLGNTLLVLACRLLPFLLLHLYPLPLAMPSPLLISPPQVEPARNIATLRLPRQHVPAICTMRTRTASHAHSNSSSGIISGVNTSTSNAFISQQSSSQQQGQPLTAATATAVAAAAASGHSEGHTAPQQSLQALSRSWEGGQDASGGHDNLSYSMNAIEGSVLVVVASATGMLCEYSLEDLDNPAGPKCALEGEWSLLGTNTMQG